MSKKKIYLGDSVYCEFDGNALILTTENGYGASNTIVLEVETMDALSNFYQGLLNQLKEPEPEPGCKYCNCVCMGSPGCLNCNGKCTCK